MNEWCPLVRARSQSGSSCSPSVLQQLITNSTTGASASLCQDKKRTRWRRSNEAASVGSNGNPSAARPASQAGGCVRVCSLDQTSKHLKLSLTWKALAKRERGCPLTRASFMTPSESSLRSLCFHKFIFQYAMAMIGAAGHWLLHRRWLRFAGGQAGRERGEGLRR